jgi:hypothetical protein
MDDYRLEKKALETPPATLIHCLRNRTAKHILRNNRGGCQVYSEKMPNTLFGGASINSACEYMHNITDKPAWLSSIFINFAGILPLI